MEQAIEAYRNISASDRLREMQRMRDIARVNEAYALQHAREEERKKWQDVVAEKDAVLSERLREIERMRDKARVNEAYALQHAREEERKNWEGVVADLRTENANKDVLIAELKTRLGEQ